jgi:uncharacterized protein with PIN domain
MDQPSRERCPYCHTDVETYEYFTECVGQYGRNVVSHTVCTECGEQLKEKLVDKDI